LFEKGNLQRKRILHCALLIPGTHPTQADMTSEKPKVRKTVRSFVNDERELVK
jgi:hypothetical protein